MGRSQTRVELAFYENRKAGICCVSESTFATKKHSQPGSMLEPSHPLAGLEEPIQSLQSVGSLFYQRGWSVGTSSNYSIVLKNSPLELLVTASGKDKGRLGPTDFVRIGAGGKPLVPGQPKSSAETMLHVAIAEQLPVGAILHTHSVWATELSELYFPQGRIVLTGYEMLKGLAGITTHEATWELEIFDNTQDIPSLADRLRERLSATSPLRYGFLIRRHGMYTWGEEIEEARRHVEIIEFLLACVGRGLLLKTVASPTS